MDLKFKTFGNGTPLIILHGLFGMLDNWQTVAKKMAEHYQVYIVDLPNHGRSPHTQQMDYPYLADALLSFMEDNWLFESHLIGHSMGGKVAMRAALSSPEFFHSLIIVDIAPKKYEPGHDHIFDALKSVDLDNIQSRQEVSEYLEQRISDPEVVQFLMKNLTREKDGAFKWKMNLPVIDRNYHVITDEVVLDGVFEQPTLFIRGSDSGYIKEDDIEEVKPAFPEAQLTTINGAGHWVHVDKPEIFVQTMLDFLSTITP